MNPYDFAQLQAAGLSVSSAVILAAQHAAMNPDAALGRLVDGIRERDGAFWYLDGWGHALNRAGAVWGCENIVRGAADNFRAARLDWC